MARTCATSWSRLGYDVDKPWRELPKKDRDWILYTDEQPTVPVYAGYTPAETRRALRRKEEPSYQGTFTGVRKYVLQTFATTQSALMKRRVQRFMSGTLCPSCRGKRLKREAPWKSSSRVTTSAPCRRNRSRTSSRFLNPRRRAAPTRTRRPARKSASRQRASRRASSSGSRHSAHSASDYLSLERGTPSLSPGELQRLRLATQIRSNLFGVVYVLDEPSAGLHPADTEALLAALDQLKGAGNSLFVVEHDLEVMRRADWIVDVGPGAGEHGGRVLYSGPFEGFAALE